MTTQVRPRGERRTSGGRGEGSNRSELPNFALYAISQPPFSLLHSSPNITELHPFMKYSINNLGDPFITSNYGVHSRQFEVSVIDFFAKLWKIEKGEYWGYVTTCGTEGNLHGILLARECHPDGILYSSRETHYSIFKAARYYRMDAKR